MPIQRVAIVAFLFLFTSPFALCCSCSNNTPIQNTAERYRENAVFTAHVVELIGKTYDWDGKQLSERVLAVVKEQYWGLPWYWPKVVILDGSYPCDIAMALGEDYLVSGSRGRYGVLVVNGCSRTQPLKTAQLDLRTLDGSHCAAPGGTILGYVSKGDNEFTKNTLASNVSVRFRDQEGKLYTAQSDSNGIYELRHLPPGNYNVESLAGPDHYASGGAIVSEGLCLEASILFKPYSVRGRLLPEFDADVLLEGTAASADQALRTRIEPDGRFYFTNVPDGEYLLSVKTSVQGQEKEMYYPGTFDRQKAQRLKFKNHMLADGATLDFDPKKLPIVPIPITLNVPNGSKGFSWHVELLSGSTVIEEKEWISGAKFVLLHGVRDWSYGIRIRGFSVHPSEYGDCGSDLITTTAKPGMTSVPIPIPANCL
jgi:hypothetical protein